MDVDVSSVASLQTPLSSSPIPDSESGSFSQQRTQQPPAEQQNKCNSCSSITRTGPDLMQFLMDTLNKNQKDRIHLLKIEKELTDLVKDSERQHYKFAPMSSYHRMLVHRVAAFFGMDHNVDSLGSSVIVNKTTLTKLPEFKFSEQLKDSEITSNKEPQKSILKRESNSLEEMTKDCKDKSPDRRNGSNCISLVADSRRSKSFEEREVQYEKARARIFNQDSSSSTEGNDSSNHTSGSSGENTSSSTSGIALSINLTSSSQSELSSHDPDFKTNNINNNNTTACSVSSTNGNSKDSNIKSSSSKQSDSRPWSSLESNTSTSGRPRFLRLQRQKRLPNSFDSDSTRTSSTLSSSMSSSSGMFLTPEGCIPDHSLCDASRSSFTKASSFGGISFSNRDNSSGINCEPKLTKTGSLNVPSLADNGTSLQSFSFPVATQEASVVSPHSNTPNSAHTWPKKQSKNSINSSNTNITSSDIKSSTNLNSNLSTNDNMISSDAFKNVNQPDSTSEQKERADMIESNPEAISDDPGPSVSTNRSQTNCNNKCENPNTESNLTKNKSFSQSHHKTISKSSSQHSNMSNNQPCLHDRHKGYNHFDKEKTHLGPPNLIITPVSSCLPQMMNSKTPLINQTRPPIQPIYYLPYLQANTPSIAKPIINHTVTGSRSKSNRHITNQMSSLSINSHNSSRNDPNNCGIPSNHLPSTEMTSNVLNCGSIPPSHISVNDMNLRTTVAGGSGGSSGAGSSSGYLMNPRRHKSITPPNKVSNASRLPLGYMAPNMSGSNGHPIIRLPNPNATPTVSNVIDPNSMATIAYNDRYMSGLPTHHQSAISHTANTYLNVPNIQASVAPVEMDIMYQSSNVHSSKSNVLLLSSSSPALASNTFQALPIHTNRLQGIPPMQSHNPSQTQPARLCHPSPHLANIPSPSNSGLQTKSIKMYNNNLVTGNLSTSAVAVANSIHLKCYNNLATPSTSQFSYAFNPLSLSSNPSQTGGSSPYSYAHPIQAPLPMPFYGANNSTVGGGGVGGGVSPQIISGPRPMTSISPQTPSHMMQHPISTQAPMYRPVPLFFLFNFQNKRSN